MTSNRVMIDAPRLKSAGLAHRDRAED